ncbi:MAG: FKBP-type peptidyl-prolyl cis-trans isomerase [Myxococcales bacterium]|nr:FKBP-type peptidyl-prolyl cis-trans isomerase [Myxococcales bacterium]
MRSNQLVITTLALLAISLGGCDKKVEKKQDAPKTASDKKPGRERPNVPPPFDVANPPADAERLPSGLIFKQMVAGTGESPGANDTALVNYNAWRPDGTTMNSTKMAGRPVPMSLFRVAPGFREALQKMKKGGKAMFWLPPEIGFKQRPQARAGSAGPETIAYEVELVEIQPAPPTPADVAAPPATAKKLSGGVAVLSIAEGTGQAARNFDTVSFHVTGWDATGKMLESSRASRPANGLLFRESAGFEAVLTGAKKGDKLRAWIPVAMVRKNPDAPTEGLLCYEFEVLEIKPGKQPPTAPAAVAAPPKDAQKTAKGVFYKVLKKGTGTAKPVAADTVEVHYTGWTTDGRMFDSSVVRGEPTQFPLGGVIPGWTDGLQVMTVGEKTLFWIPEELAYKGKPGRPQGMLVFEVELLTINPEPKASPTRPTMKVGPAGQGPAGAKLPVMTKPAKP